MANICLSSTFIQFNEANRGSLAEKMLALMQPAFGLENYHSQDVLYIRFRHLLHHRFSSALIQFDLIENK